MNTFPFGPSAQRLSRIGLGTWPMDGRDWGEPDDELAIATIHTALDLGVNVFDTAPAYGPAHCEEVLGRALVGRREEAFVATKCGIRWNEVRYYQDLSPDSIRFECEESLRRLRTDHIDLLQIHWPHDATPLEDSLDAMERLQQEGKVLHLGVSNFEVPLLERALARAPIASLQPPYHLFMRGVERELLPYCRERGLATFVYGPLCKGLLSGKWQRRPIPDDIRRKDPFFGEGVLEQLLPLVDELVELARTAEMTPAQLALAHALSRPGISCALVGARRPEQIRETARAAELTMSDELSQCVENIVGRAPRVV
ncbi:MAG: aldo/keto reductase [Planctomycetes bacterium]|nr:aldo/keto reductase [Planctomycetota bacterium]